MGVVMVHYEHVYNLDLEEDYLNGKVDYHYTKIRVMKKNKEGKT